VFHQLTARERLLAAVLILATGAAAVLSLLEQQGLALAGLSVAVLLIGLTVVETRARTRRLGGQVQRGLQKWSRLTEGLTEEIGQTRTDVGTTHQQLTELDASLQSRVEELSQQFQNSWSTKDKRWDRLTVRLGRDRVELQRQLLAMAQLLPRIDASAPLPAPGGWAAEASTLLHLSDLIQRHRPRLVVECGSGTSTVWLGHVLRGTGGRLVALEHDGGYAEQTREQLRAHGLSDVAEVRHAPLQELTIGGEELTWYDTDAVQDLEQISLLFVDGPPQGVHKTVRYPALPVLGPRLAPGALVVLDDGHRPGEQEVVKRWLDETEGLHLHQDSVDLAVTFGFGHTEGSVPYTPS